MSKFFKALEQAEREQALRKQAGQEKEDLAGVGPNRHGEVELAVPQQKTALLEDPGILTIKVPSDERGEPPRAGSPMAAEDSSAPEAVNRPLVEPFRCPLPGAAPDLAEESPSGVDPHMVSLLTPTAFEAEQYRTLRHIVEQLYKNAGPVVIAISSPAVGDGKTITLTNLAGSLAQAPEARVLLVDADLRRSSASRGLGLSSSGGRGLVGAILDPALSLEEVVCPLSLFNLAVLPAGRPPASPYEVLKSPRMGVLLEEARRRYDYIVLDTPPLIPFPDCRLIGKWVDGFLVVVAAHKTPRKQIEEALQVLEPARLLGLVFNRDDHSITRGHYYYYPNGSSSNGGWRGRVSRMAKTVGSLGRPRR